VISTEYNDEGRGVLFKNDTRENERQPLYRDEAPIDGQRYRLSAWINEAKSGGNYLRITFTPDQPQEHQ
jgi:hypothetical protein